MHILQKRGLNEWIAIHYFGIGWKYCILNNLSEMVKNVKLSLWLTKNHAMKTYRENGGIAPSDLHLSTRWRWVVTSRTGRPWFRLRRRLSRPQSRSGCGGKESPISASAGNWTPIVQPIADSLYWLSYLAPIWFHNSIERIVLLDFIHRLQGFMLCVHPGKWLCG
jgi:hypothetical protein